MPPILPEHHPKRQSLTKKQSLIRPHLRRPRRACPFRLLDQATSGLTENGFGMAAGSGVRGTGWPRHGRELTGSEAAGCEDPTVGITGMVIGATDVKAGVDGLMD